MTRRHVIAVLILFGFALVGFVLLVSELSERDTEGRDPELGALILALFSALGAVAWRWPRVGGAFALVLAVLGILPGLFAGGIAGLALFVGPPLLVAILLLTGD